MSKGIRVTVEDLQSGESESTVIDNDYVLITAGTCYRSHVNAHANGTHVLTIKGRAPSPGLDPGEVVAR